MAKFTFLNIYIFKFLHGGLLWGPESLLDTAYYVQYLTSRRLILHFYIFLFLHGGLLRGPESQLERLILSNIWTRDG